MIELQAVSKKYGEGAGRIYALKSIDLYVPAGQFVSIMGPSGSGKSTLLNLVSALDQPTAGRIVIAGQDISVLDDDALTLFRRRSVGLVFQFFNLLPTLSALDNVLLPVMIERKIGAADRKRAQELFAQVGLAAHGDRQMHELSGGQMQRVAIARALMLEPRLILADEPTGNLDSVTGASVLELLKGTCESTGTTLIMVTHDKGAAEVGDRVITLKDGAVIEDRLTRVSAIRGVAE